MRLKAKARGLSGTNDTNTYGLRLVESDSRQPADAPVTPIRTLWQLTEVVDSVVGNPGAAGHSRRVADLAAAVALHLGAPREEIELITLAARLHDLGLLTVPVEILEKDDLLSQVERTALQNHPEMARRILVSLGAVEMAEWVFHQNERWDGSGRPCGLAGEAIPFASRVVAAAEAFDAMTNDRPYRSAISIRRSLAEMARCAGTQFDPSVVEALVAVVHSKSTAVAATA
jgi:HD-GYP domain-containing protein (c-di-GMP phosphodiesterase class II)